jgi:hypothetical protein
MAMQHHAKHEVYSAAQVLVGLAVVALVMVGIGGTIYKVISPEGWISQAFGRSLSAGAAALGSLLLIAGLSWFSRGWASPKTRNRHADLMVYTFAAAGMFYLAKLWLKGSF